METKDTAKRGLMWTLAIGYALGWIVSFFNLSREIIGDDGFSGWLFGGFMVAVFQSALWPLFLLMDLLLSK